MEYKLKSSNMRLIGFPEGKMKKIAEKKFGEVIVEDFPEVKKNMSPEIESNCGVTFPVLI